MSFILLASSCKHEPETVAGTGSREEASVKKKPEHSEAVVERSDGSPLAPKDIDRADAIRRLSSLSADDLSLEGANADALKSLIAHYSKDQFEEVWKIVSKIGPPNYLRRPWIQLMLGRMVSDGDRESLSRATSAIQNSKGLGANARSLIDDIFSSAKPSKDSVSIAASIEDPSERATAFNGISRTLIYLKDLSSLDASAFQGIKPEETQLLLRGIAMRVSQSVSLQSDKSSVLGENILFVRGLVDQGAVPADAVARMITEASGGAPFDAWNAIKGDFGAYDAGMIGQITENMAKSDPGKALKVLTENDNLAPAAVTEAMSAFLIQDNSEAATWYDSHKATLTSQQDDSIKVAMANYAMRAGDAANASRWADGIADAKVREELKEKIEKK